MSDDEELTKVVVDLPTPGGPSGESMWAKALGEDLYEIRNVPFFAYGLNFGDTVRAVSPAPDLKPVVIEVVRAGGFSTLRVWISEHVDPSDGHELMASLIDLHAYYESSTDDFFAISVEPEGDYEAVCERLLQWTNEGLLDYETCETRVEGSFDDAPSEDD
jgi:uncharacterized protein DUF4265